MIDHSGLLNTWRDVSDAKLTNIASKAYNMKFSSVARLYPVTQPVPPWVHVALVAEVVALVMLSGVSPNAQ